MLEDRLMSTSGILEEGKGTVPRDPQDGVPAEDTIPLDLETGKDTVPRNSEGIVTRNPEKALTRNPEAETGVTVGEVTVPRDPKGTGNPKTEVTANGQPSKQKKTELKLK